MVKSLVPVSDLLMCNELQSVRPFFPVDLKSIYVDSFLFLHIEDNHEGLALKRKLVVVSCLSFKEGASELCDYLADIVKSGPPVIGIQLCSREKDPVFLQEVTDVARKFPLLMIPDDVSVLSLEKAFSAAEIHGKSSMSVSRLKNFGDIVLGGGGLTEILESISSVLDLDCAFLGMRNNSTVVSSSDDDFTESIKIFPLKEILRLYIGFPIKYEGRHLGYLVLNRDFSTACRLPLFSYPVVENAITAIKFIFRERCRERLYKKQYRDQLVRDLIYNKVSSAEEVGNRMQSFGWNLNQGIFVLLLSVVEPVRNKSMDGPTDDTADIRKLMEYVFPVIVSRIKAFFPSAVYLELNKSIVFIVPSEGQPRTDIRRSMEYFLEEVDGTFPFGAVSGGPVKLYISIGGCKNDILLSHESYGEAVQALKFLNLFAPDTRVVFWDELGAYKIISRMAGTEEASTFCSGQLGKLLAYDERHNSDLLKTLYVLEDNNWNLSIASEKLCIHYNTMKYRYRKIADMLSADLDESETRFNIALSLRFLRITSN